MRALIASLLLLFTSLAPAAGDVDRSPFGTAAGNPIFLPVDEAYRLEVEVQEDRSLRLYWQITQGYYLYQHRLAFTLEDAEGPIALDVTLPEGLEREDEYFGQVEVYYQGLDLQLRPQRPGNLATLSVVSQGCADAGLCYPPQNQFFEINFDSGSVSPLPPPGRTTPAQPSSLAEIPAAEAAGIATLLYMMLMAFLGGSILNLMPCVFPILSLKVLSFARSTDHDRHVHGWVYGAGVVASFVLVAAVLIALQQAGQAIGWGFQLQSPGFVIALAYLFVAMGLSLSGLIEFGGNVMNAGSGLADRGGYSGSFFTGVLAVVVASPCTAPFMGTALGFALGQPPQVALLVFAALGAGMAAPLLLLSYSTTARKLMPRPGAWMDTLKQLLAFPLYGTAIWLLWVAGRQTGVNTMTAALTGVLVLAMGLWLWGYGGWRKGLALVCMLGAVALGGWRGLDQPNSPGGSLANGTVPWSEQALAQLRQEGKPVFVDVTADWCITCLANESAVLFSDEVSAAFAAHGVVYMVADWTNYNADIADFLRQHNRSGIPLYLMYPADPGAEPRLLPQLLTRSMVLDALDEVSPIKPEIARGF